MKIVKKTRRRQEQVMIFQESRWFVATFCFLAVLWLGTGAGPALATGLNAQDMLKIKGSWVRTDAPYVVEFYNDQEDGSVQAMYFNPRPINVEKTEIMESGGLLHVMVVLRDVRYPGSIYLLAYDREQDALHGTYFHALSGQSYEVNFGRKAEQ